MHEKASQAYGVAGAEFLKKVLEKEEEKPDYSKGQFEGIKAELLEEFPESLDSHVVSISAVILADSYMRRFFFNEKGEENCLYGFFRIRKAHLIYALTER